MKRLPLFFAFFFASAAFGQTGFPLYGSLNSAGQIDSVNLQNLNTVVTIPILSVPGRGLNFSAPLVYNTFLWNNAGGTWNPYQWWTTANTCWGWPCIPQAPNSGPPTYSNVGTVTWSFSATDGVCGCDRFGENCTGNTEQYTYSNFVYWDVEGTLHSFNLTARGNLSDCRGDTYSGTYTGYSTDGLYYMNINGGNNPSSAPNSYWVYTTDGAKIDVGGSFPIVTDRNGNYFQAKDVSGAEVDWTDTTGRTVMKVVNNSGNIEFHYTDPNNTDQKFVLKYQPYSVMTNFGCSGILEYNSSGTMPQVNLPYELDLPDISTNPNSKFTFVYEGTPGQAPNTYFTGRLAQINLPTGGSVSYSYGGSNDGVNCTDGSIVNLKRTLSTDTNPAHGNSWLYVRTNVSGSAGTTTVTAPQMPYDSAANAYVYTFNASGEQTQEVDYQNGSTAVRTLNATWSTNGSPATQVTILPTQSGTIQSEEDTTYDNYGNLTQVVEYDWGSGAHGAKIRTTSKTMQSISAPVPFLVPVTKTISDGNGTVQWRQDIAYDGSALADCPTGEANHDDTDFGCSFAYRGNPTSVTSYPNPATAPNGGIAKASTYDFFGNLITEQADCCQLRSFTFSTATNYSYPDRVVNGASPSQVTESFTWNANTGQLMSDTDPNLNTTSFAYDLMMRQTNAQRPDGANVATCYSGSTNTVTSTSPISGKGTASTCAGTSVAQMVTVYDGLGRPQTVTTEDSGGGNASTVVTVYDPAGRLYQTSNPYTGSAGTCFQSSFYCVETDFDALTRPTVMKLQDDSSQHPSRTTISYTGNCDTTTDPVGKARKTCSDASGRRSMVVEDPGNLAYNTYYCYNVLDEIAQINQGGTACSQGGQSRTYSYDGIGRLTSSVTPEAGMLCIGTVSAGSCQGNGYDTWGDLTTRTDARGVVTSYSYDSLNRLHQVTYNVGTTGVVNPGTVTYSYGTNQSQDNNGRLISMTDGVGSESYTYDPYLGNVTGLTKTIGSTNYPIAYSYNYANEPTQITYPSGRILTQSYDTIGRLCAIAPTGSSCTPSFYYASNFGYTTAQQLNGFTYGNDVVASLSYSGDGRQQLTSLAYAANASNVFALNYYYKQDSVNCPNGTTSNNGQIQCIVDTNHAGRSVSYSYDSVYRIATAATAGDTSYPQWGLSWLSVGNGYNGYDAYGNRQSQAVTAGSAPSNCLAISTATNQITGTCSQSGGFGYDANGNMTNDGLNTLTFDAENRVVTANSSSTYSYDGHGQRVQKSASGTTTVYIFAGPKVIAEYDNGATVSSPSREYIYSGNSVLARIDSSGTKYYHHDHLSNRMITDSNGNVLLEQGHFPYGENWYAKDGSGNNIAPDKWQFTSYERDSDTGNDYAESRHHINRLGRFSSPDPIAGNISDPQSLNRYSYVRNMTIDAVDPLGLTMSCMLANQDSKPGASLSSSPSGPSGNDSGDVTDEDLDPAPQGLTCVQIVQRGLMQTGGLNGGGGGGGGDNILDGVDISADFGNLQNGDTDPSDPNTASPFTNREATVTCPGAPGCSETVGVWNPTGGDSGKGAWVLANYDCSGGKCGYLTPSAEYELDNSSTNNPGLIPWIHSGNDSPVNASPGGGQLNIIVANMALQRAASKGWWPTTPVGPLPKPPSPHAPVPSPPGPPPPVGGPQPPTAEFLSVGRGALVPLPLAPGSPTLLGGSVPR